MTKLVAIRFAEAAEIWIQHLHEKHAGFREPAKRATHIRNHVMRYFADHIVCNVKDFDLQRLRWSLATLGEPLAGDVITTMRRFFDFGVGRNWVAANDNPATARIVRMSDVSRRLKAQMERTAMLALPSRRELKRLIKQSEDVARTALHLLILAGLRGNEARALRHEHLTFDESEGWRLNVEEAYSTSVLAPFVLGLPKTAAGRRFVNVGPELLRHLRQLSDTQQGCDHFLQRDGEPLTAEDLTLIVRKEQARLGIGRRRVRPQGGQDYPGTYGIRHFRHAFVALLIFDGYDDRAIAEVVGHSSSIVTLDIYGYLFELFSDKARTWPSGISPDEDIDTDLWEQAA